MRGVAKLYWLYIKVFLWDTKPSVVFLTMLALKINHLFWAERSACDQRSKLRYATILGKLIFSFLHAVTKILEAAVVGFQIFAWAPK